MHPPPRPSAAPRAAHPVEAELALGLDLSSRALRARPDAAALEAFTKMMANAEYWLSFDLASFEPTLSLCPSPLRELGVAVLLKFGEDVGGALAPRDIERAQDSLHDSLPEDLLQGVLRGLETLRRAVHTRDRAPALTADGFARRHHDAGVAAHALRAMGAAHITIEGVPDKDKAPELELGAVVTVRATDERGRPLAPPDIECRAGAEVLERDAGEARQVVFLIPGRYQIRVPNKASGARKVLVR